MSRCESTICVMRQTRLPGVERLPLRVSHNLFFALWPGDAVRDQIETAARQLKRANEPRGRLIKRHRYHLTLQYLGEHPILPENLVTAACAAGNEVRGPGFDFALDTAGSFANRKIPWWLGCSRVSDGLAALCDEIIAGLRKSGSKVDDDAL